MLKKLKKYLITSPEFYTQEAQQFEQILRGQLRMHSPDYALYRDKQNPNVKELAGNFISVCREFVSLVSIIHTDATLAHELGAHGVHFGSKDFDKIKHAKELGLYVIISTHNEAEIEKAIEEGADAITYSPIFETPNKGEPKGIEALQHVIKKYPIKIFALGGIVESS
ncbi:MAG: thiamine phosphate synthase, partial [Sulfurimonadaceae bacterium]|nr:thiamine phosphate synthase [Sulfurimonadaceae bacterium]